jgi:aldehyde dehydrogenase (NAD+)
MARTATTTGAAGAENGASPAKTPSIVEIYETMSYGPAPESDAQARAWLSAHAPHLRLLIGGEWREPLSGEYFATVNPATATPLIDVAQGGAEDVEAAVHAAREAFPAWSSLSGHARARYLYALARQMQKHSRLLAVLETMDNGKTIRETRDLDIPLAVRHFYHHAGWAQLMASEFPAMRPLGVVGQIIPWNFPLLMLAWKIAPALAAGNTVVLKPAEFTPITAAVFGEICQAAGLPAGVVNIVTGDGRTGEALARHPDVDKIAFTGSTEVGRILRRATAGSGKRLSLELGGKSPFIVFDDADLDSVVEGVVDAIWFNQGQVCCAGSRLLAQEDIADQLITKLRARMEKLRVGNPLDKAVDIGAIVAPVQLEKITQLVQQGVTEGATMWQPSWSCPTEGYFYPPTLFTEVSPASTIAQVEIFGPVLVAMTFRTPSEAVALANNTNYGLAASIWSENINLALAVAGEVQAGTVWVNCTNLFDAASGFGGYRESGYGREGGREGLFEYLRPVWEVTDDGDAGNGVHREQSTRGGADNRQARRGRAGHTATLGASNGASGVLPDIDRTPKLFIGGKQVRPDTAYTRAIYGSNGGLLGAVGEGTRKDVRNAVEAARKVLPGWAGATAHARAQILYYIAENLSAREDEFADRITAQVECEHEAARLEVAASIERLFTYGAWADKYDGAIHQTPLRGMTLAAHEPLGVIGLVCPEERPLLGLISLIAPAIAMGNAAIAVPSERYPLSATDFYSVLETSDVPGGVVNILTGPREPLAKILAEHDDVEAVWYFGSAEGARAVEEASAGNMKRTWCSYGHPRDWLDAEQSEGREFLREATQVKNIWIPTGE